MANDSARVDDELDVVLDGNRHLYRSELGPAVEAATVLAEELRAVEIPPGVAERHIAMALDRAGHASRRARRRLLARMLAAVAAAAVIVGVPATLVSAGALPGHPLYPLKRTVEAADLAVHFDPSREAQIHMRIAERRIAELDALVQRRDRTHLLSAIKEVKLAVEAANVAVDKAFRSEGVNSDTMALHTRLTGVTREMMQKLEDVVATPTDPAAASTASSILGTATTAAPPGVPPPTAAVPPPTAAVPPPTAADTPTTSVVPPPTTATPPTTADTPPTPPPSTGPSVSPTAPGASTGDTAAGASPTGP